jgi:hypothetical protein
MKTSTLLKKTIRTAIFLAAILLLISFNTNKIETEKNLEQSNEVSLKTTNTLMQYNVIVQQEDGNVKKDTYVLLTIDTKIINETNMDSTIVFSDDRSDPARNPGNPKEFTSIVDKNMKIYWSGIAKDPNSNAVIKIIEIIRKQDGGAEILKKTFKDPNKDGIVVGKIKNKKVEGFEYYSVKFSITQGDLITEFEVDPKLQMGLGTD